MQVSRTSAPTAPTTPDAERMAEADRRLALLGEASWRELLRAHVETQLGPLRAKIVGVPDTSANLYKSVVDQTSTLYDDDPVIDGAPEVAEQLELGGWWGLAPTNQRFAQGLRQTLVYVGYDGADGHCTFRLVPPNRVTIDVAHDNPRRILRVWWARERPIPGNTSGEEAWFWDRWDAAGEFSIWTNDRKHDMTRTFGIDPAEWSGNAYPYRDESEARRPVLPFAWYSMQASSGDSPWTPHAQSEVVFGTLQVGLLWTAAVHGVLRASWDQRVLLNGRPKGGTIEKTGSGGGARFLTPDPTSVMQIEGEGAAIGAWGASIDMTKAEQFCRLYEARLAVHFGLSPSDLVIESLNPASGASITVSQKGKRILQARQTPAFRRGDRMLAEVVAAVLRGRGGSATASAKGFRIRYPGIALTPEERQAVMVHLRQELELRLITRAEAWQLLHPGTDEKQAEAAIAKVDVELELDRAKAAVDPLAAPGAGGEAVKVADTALNGAQVTSAVDIVVKVAARELPRDAGLGMLAEFQLATNPEKVMGSVGTTFFAEPKPDTTPQFGQRQPAASDAAEEAAPEAE